VQDRHGPAAVSGETIRRGHFVVSVSDVNGEGRRDESLDPQVRRPAGYVLGLGGDGKSPS
jgi:hypothetical protein